MSEARVLGKNHCLRRDLHYRWQTAFPGLSPMNPPAPPLRRWTPARSSAASFYLTATSTGCPTNRGSHTVRRLSLAAPGTATRSVPVMGRAQQVDDRFELVERQIARSFGGERQRRNDRLERSGFLGGGSWCRSASFIGLREPNFPEVTR